MKKYISTWMILVFIVIAAQGQINQAVATGKITVSLPTSEPAWPALEDQTSVNTGVTRTRAFLEYGDGEFTTSASSIHDYTNGATALLTLTGIYDPHGPRPRPQYSKSMMVRSAGNGPNTVVNFNPSHLNDIDKYINITSNVSEALPGDPMVFAITCKIPPGFNGGKILLLYNRGTEVFYPVTSSSADIIDGKAIPRIRVYNNSFFNATNCNISRSVITGYNTHVKGLEASEFQSYQQNIAIDVAGTSLKTENTFFVTLTPGTNIESNNRSNDVRAVLIPDSFSANDTARISTENIAVNATVHDPNWIAANVNCLGIPKAGKEIRYHLHFQNEGTGVVDSLRIGIMCASNLDLSNTFWVIRLGSKVFSGITPQRLSPISYLFIIKAPPGNHLLYGTGVQEPATNDSTMGEISYTVKTQESSSDPVKATALIRFNERPFIQTNIHSVDFCNCCPCQKKQTPGLRMDTKVFTQ